MVDTDYLKEMEIMKIIKSILIAFVFIFFSHLNSYAVDYYARVILIGDSSGGKTSLWNRIFDYPFKEDESKSDMMLSKELIRRVGNNEIQFNIWDTAGAECYYDEVVEFTRGANFVIIVHDTGANFDKSKEQYLETLYGKVHDKIQHDGKVLFVGTKWDLRHKKIVNASKQQALLENVAKSVPTACVFVSSKNNTNINRVLDFLCSKSDQMELYTHNPDASVQKRFEMKKGSGWFNWCTIL